MYRTGIFGKVAGKVANAGMSEDKIVGKLSTTLCETLPKTLGDMGIGGMFSSTRAWLFILTMSVLCILPLYEWT